MHQSSTPISFHLVNDFPGWGKATDWVLDLIEHYGAREILEVGSGANPTLSAATVNERNLRYTLNDVDANELAKAEAAFQQWQCDISGCSAAEVSPMSEQFDLIFSRMVNEHVVDGARYHANVFRLLRKGGIAAHCCSTLYAFPFTVNRLSPEWLSDLVLRVVSPRDPNKHGKFPAHYSWSRGPSERMLRQFRSLGYEVLDYRGYFGHWYYGRLIPFLNRVEAFKSALLLRRPVPALCSYAVIVLRKP